MAARPAHRPSRRASVIDAAVGLFAVYPAETVTVADIAAAADMTAAAVYYHFPSKEHIILEGLQTFTRDYLAELRRWLVAPGPRGLGGSPRRGGARMVRGRRVRGDRVLRSLTPARTWRSRRSAERPASSRSSCCHGRFAKVRATAPPGRGRRCRDRRWCRWLETAAASWLTQDGVFLGLGRRRFLDGGCRPGEPHRGGWRPQ